MRGFDPATHAGLGDVSANQHHNESHGAAAHTQTLSVNPHTQADHTDRTISRYYNAGAFLFDLASAAGYGAAPNRINYASFADGSAQGISVFDILPEDAVDGSALTIDLTLLETTATTGDVRFRVNVLMGAVNTDQDTAGVSVTQTITITGGAGAVITSTFAGFGNISNPGMLRIYVERLGADAADTLAAAVGMLGVRAYLTKDQ